MEARTGKGPRLVFPPRSRSWRGFGRVRHSPEERGAVARRGGGVRRAAVIAVSVGVNEQAEEDQVEDIAR